MGRAFPASLMGVIAYIRQIYLDAAHYQIVKEAYEKNPRRHAAPRIRSRARRRAGIAADPAAGHRVVEMERMVRFAAELKQPIDALRRARRLRPEAAALLKKSDAPVLVSLKWPERTRDADPDEVESLRTLEPRDKAPGTPAVLAKAGVKFAFYSDGSISRAICSAPSRRRSMPGSRRETRSAP